MFRHLTIRAKDRFLNRLNHTIRFLLLLISLAAAGTATLWMVRPNLIHKWDQRLVKVYILGYEERLNEAKATLRKGETEAGRAQLDHLLTDLALTAKGDRLFDVKVRAMDTLVRDYARTGEVDAQLALYDRWIAIDDHDLRPQIRRAVLKRAHPEHRAEGDAEMLHLNTMAPGSPLIMEAMADLQLSGGAVEPAFNAFRKQLPGFRAQAANLNWAYFWDIGSSFNGNHRKEVKGAMKGDFTVAVTHQLAPHTYKGLRVDIPAALAMLVYNARFELQTPGEPTIIALADAPLGLHDIEQQGTVLKARGANPFFELRLSEPIQLTQATQITFHATIVPYNFDKLSDKLTDDAAREGLSARLTQAGDTEGLALLRQLTALLPQEEGQ